MASLNDDVEEGLNSEIKPDELIQPPTANKKPQVQMTFVTNVDSAEPQPNTDNVNIIEEVPDPGKLPDINPTFEIVEQNHTTVTNLKQVEEQISSQETISREDASLIDDMFGDFFNKRLSAREFTLMRTKTNFPYASRFMRERIAQEEAQLFNQFKVFFEEPLEDFKQFEHHYEHYYIPFIRDQILSIRTTHGDILDQIFESKNVVIPWGPEQKECINLLSLPTRTELVDNQAIEPILNQALSNIRIVLTNVTFVGYMQSVLSNGISVSEWKQLISHDDYYENELVFGDIVKFYKSPFVLESLDNMLLTIRATVVLFNNLAQSAALIESDFTKLDEYITRKVPDIKALNDQLQTLFEVAKNLALLNVSAKAFFDFLGKRCM